MARKDRRDFRFRRVLMGALAALIMAGVGLVPATPAQAISANCSRPRRTVYLNRTENQALRLPRCCTHGTEQYGEWPVAHHGYDASLVCYPICKPRSVRGLQSEPGSLGEARAFRLPLLAEGLWAGWVVYPASQKVIKWCL